MGWLDFFKRAPKKRDSDDFAMTRWMMAPIRPGSMAVLQMWRVHPWLRAVVDKAADGVAGVNWRLYKAVDQSGAPKRLRSFQRMAPAARFERRRQLIREQRLIEVDDHPALDVLCDPNDYLSGRASMHLLQRHLDLTGESFMLLHRRNGGSTGQVDGFWLLPTTAILRIPSPGHAEKTYRISYGKNQFEVPAENVIHFRHPDCDDPLARGVGMAFSLGDELDSDEYAARFIKNYFFNNATPAAVVSIENMPEGNTPAAKAWKEAIAREHGGPNNAGKIFMTGGKVQIARVTGELVDMQLVELRRFLKDFIRQCYGVPPEVMGDVSSSNKATAIAAQSLFAVNCLLPRMEYLRTELQHKFMPLFDPSGTLILDYDSPVPADRDLELRVATAAPWSRSVNEWRELQGLEPLPEFDGVFPPLSMPGQAPGSAADAKPGEPGAATDDDQPKPPEEGEGAPAPELPSGSGGGKKSGDPAWASAPLP